MPPVPKPPAAQSSRNRNLIIALAVAAVVVVALIAASLLRSSGDSGSAGSTDGTVPGATTPAGTTTTGAGDPALALVAGIPQSGTMLGRAGTTVRMLQFEDLQCPICKRYTDEAFPTVVNEYVRTGRLRLDFRGLAFLGPDSVKALRIALAAGLQNKLWQVVGLFYEHQGTENSGWVTDALVDQILAQVPGLDAAKVKADAQSARVTTQMAAVQTEATKLGVQGTPWFFFAVGFNPPVEFQPRSLSPGEFRNSIDQALQATSQ